MPSVETLSSQGSLRSLIAYMPTCPGTWERRVPSRPLPHSRTGSLNSFTLPYPPSLRTTRPHGPPLIILLTGTLPECPLHPGGGICHSLNEQVHSSRCFAPTPMCPRDASGEEVLCDPYRAAQCISGLLFYIRCPYPTYGPEPHNISLFGISTWPLVRAVYPVHALACPFVCLN